VNAIKETPDFSRTPNPETDTPDTKNTQKGKNNNTQL
jgi:hypothetical protein